MQILQARLRRNTICCVSLSAKHRALRTIDMCYRMKKQANRSPSGAGISRRIIRIISRIVIPGIVAGLSIRKKAIDIISRIISRGKPSGKSCGVLAQVLKLILSVRWLAFVVSQVKMRRIVVIRVFERSIGDRKTPRRSAPTPETASSRKFAIIRRHFALGI